MTREDVHKQAANNGLNPAKRALSPVPTNDKYSRCHAPGVEQPVQDEEAKTQITVETMNRMQEHKDDKHRRTFTATHSKTQGIVKGTPTVPEELSIYLRQGLFEDPGSHPVAVPIANEPMFLQADQEPGPRGKAMRVLGVKGEHAAHVLGSEMLSTQDLFLETSHP